jgi:hypothetical protein
MKKKPKVKVKKNNDDNNFDYMKTTKDNINNVIRDKSIIGIINNIVINTNKIVVHAYNFMKLYVLHLYDNNKEIPLLDKEFICDIFKAVTYRKSNSGGYTNENMPIQQKTLQQFYNTHYKETIDATEKLYYDKMNYILAYEAIDMATNINNNIQENYFQYVNKFVNVSFQLKDKLKKITDKYKTKDARKKHKKALYDEFKLIKNDLLSFSELKSLKKYHKWIIEQRKKILPKKDTFDKESIAYDIKSNTQDYLKPFIYLNVQFEKIYDKDEKDKHTIKLFNILPLRTNIVPKHIVIDTPALIQNLINGETQAKHLKDYKKGNNQHNLWNRIFKLNKRSFKKGKKYSFHHMIRTDGISINIIFVRNGPDGMPLKKCPQNITKEEENMEYIEKVTWTNELKAKKVVCIDPNYGSLIYCGAKDKDGNLDTFRYTQNQRRNETKQKKYNKIIRNINEKTIIRDNKTVKQLETVLSNHNCKTCNYNKFKLYITEKNKLNLSLFNHYEQEFFRKFKLNRYTNGQKSENKMIQNFENKFGKPEDIIISIGDFDKGGNNMKGKEPVILKKFRRIFKNAGYVTYLINEFRTSKLCNCCHNELEHFMEIISKKPKYKGKNHIETVNGLLGCKSIKPKCEIIHNRDKNAVQNMLYIVETLKTTGKRPKEYSHETV